MKLTSSLTLPPSPFTLANFKGTLTIKRQIYLSVYCLLMAALWNTNYVLAAPAKLDSLDATFPLDLQPPIFEASAASQTNGENDATATTIDSYGNPIESLQPIETPDGRKVVSAQGLQFEIPNYASGITELKKPADDLLPPFVDPIVVALPNASPESFTLNADSSSSAETSTVEVENVPLVKVRPTQNGLPEYILELNDPDIDGPVAYEPSEDNRGLKVIAWDLLPPIEAEETDKTISHSSKVSITSDHNPNAQATKESSHAASSNHLETTTTANPIQNRGSAFYSTTSTTRSTTPKSTTTRRTTTTTTTTTPRTTTTYRTTTTRTTPKSTTTPRTTTLRTTTTTTTPQPDPSTFFKLENGDSYTLPTWLQEFDYPDLDVAVEFAIPEDLNEYNQTLERDILPPLEPYTDLNNLHVTPPASTAAPKTTTTTLKTTTTTKRPIVSTSQPHWVRARPTVAKPTIATFNNQFASPSQTIISSSSNFAQRTSSTKKPITTTTTATTTTTTVKPKTTTNYNNRVSTTTPQTDKFGSDSNSEEVTTQIKAKNPFLPANSFDDGKYRPQNYAGRQNTATTTRRPTTTTTTTTTTTPAPVEKNPFQPTIPPYLQDFDYPDLGPGVPFVYDPNEDENPVDKNILPPSQTIEDSDKPASASASAFNPSSSNSPFSNSQTPQGFTNKFTTSAISLASSSSIPSIVTAPLPSTQTNQDEDDLSTATQPPVVFVPPPPTAAEGIKTTFNKNFAASFEPATTSSAASFSPTAVTEKKVPLSADRESFPPFNNVIAGSSTLPSKTTFTKSEDGKVITNNIFLSGNPGSTTSVKPLAFSSSASSQEKNAFASGTQSFTKTSTTTSVLGTTSAADSGFGGEASSTFGSKYTGRFGGPPGVLAPQNSNGFTTASTTVTKTFNKPAFASQTVTTSTATTGSSANHKFTGSFGGPPGILKPYDNVKNG